MIISKKTLLFSSILSLFLEISRCPKKLNPKLAIISAGRNNRYGHPNAETLVTLKKNKVPFVITAQSGMIKLKVDQRKKFKIETFDQTDIKVKKGKNESSADH